MTVTQDLSLLPLFLNASLLVKLVMALLLAVSVMSWAYIFRKMFALRRAQTQTEEFERAF
ncbi:MAG: protein TolQ, partial [Herbaspirillum sp.]